MGRCWETGWNSVQVPRQSFTRQRSNAWLYNFRRLVVRYERSAEVHTALIHLACALVMLIRVFGRFLVMLVDKHPLSHANNDSIFLAYTHSIALHGQHCVLDSLGNMVEYSALYGPVEVHPASHAC